MTYTGKLKYWLLDLASQNADVQGTDSKMLHSILLPLRPERHEPSFHKPPKPKYYPLYGEILDHYSDTAYATNDFPRFLKSVAAL